MTIIKNHKVGSILVLGSIFADLFHGMIDRLAKTLYGNMVTLYNMSYLTSSDRRLK